MIRPLTVAELPLCLEGGKSFFDEGKMPGGFKPEVFLTNWRRLLVTSQGVVLGMFRADGAIMGALGGLLAPDLNNGDLLAVECFFYMIPSERGSGVRLLYAYEDWARSQGCIRAAMVHLQHLQPERLGQLYERLGYRKIEVCYVKELP